MGELYLHNLDEYIDKYDIKVFVETGSGKGTGINHALQYKFTKLYSIEIMDEMYDFCLNKFKDDRLKLICSRSIDGLELVLDCFVEKEDPILFWLDAHFPGADFQLGKYEDEHPDNIKLPLEEELNIIYNSREDCKDVFIIDDLQLFEDGDYELKIENDYLKNLKLDNEFIFDLFSDTHNFVRDFRHQGFLIGVPK